MNYSLIFLSFCYALFVFVACDNEEDSLSPHVATKISGLLDSYLKKHVPVRKNRTYVDISENEMRIPQTIQPVREKKVKKNPKRTIQKIIKKNTSKRRYYKAPQIIQTTEIPEQKKKQANRKIEKVTNDYPDDSNSRTEQPMSKRRQRKWKQNSQRNPPLFQNVHRRNKRKLERDNTFIFKDLDEVKFVDTSNKDYDTARVHVKKYW